MTPSTSGSTDLTARAHLDGADENVRFASALVASSSSDGVAMGWAVTALFYAAVHETRAYLVARHQRRVVAHDDMRGVWNAYPEMSAGRAPYTDLKQQSESARSYLNRELTADDFAHFRGLYSRIRSLLRSKTERAIRDAGGSGT